MSVAATQETLNQKIEIAYAASLAVAALLYSALRKTAWSLQNNDRTALKTFEKPSPWKRFMKREVLYAPLWRLRHSRELRLHKGVINLGSLPDRTPSLLILLLTALNIFLCTWNIPWSSPAADVVTLFRNRLGSVAVSNFILVVISSSFQPLLPFMFGLRIDGINLFHRWFARMTILEALTHILTETIGTAVTEGDAGLTLLISRPYVQHGLTAGVAFFIILIQASKPFRTFSYEIFHYLHISLAIVGLVFLWLHLAEHYQRYYVLVAAIMWATARSMRFLITIYGTWGKDGLCSISIAKLPGDAVKVTILPAQDWGFKPGQFMYIAIPAVQFWSAHPFSIAWSDDGKSNSSQTDLTSSRQSEEKDSQTDRLPQFTTPPVARRTYSLIIKKEGGMTKKLFELAEKQSSKDSDLHNPYTALIQGPYDEPRILSSYDTVVLVAGGVGITNQIAYVKEILEDRQRAQSLTKVLTLLWVVPNADCLEWIRPWLFEIEQMRKVPGDKLRIHIYVTRSGHDQNEAGMSTEMFSEGGVTKIYYVRPDIASVAKQEIQAGGGRTCVTVCASGSLSDQTRKGVRDMLKAGTDLNLYEEGYAW